jgi:hypothetical protein
MSFFKELLTMEETITFVFMALTGYLFWASGYMALLLRDAKINHWGADMLNGKFRKKLSKGWSLTDE